MKIGTYKDKPVKVHDSGFNFIIEFENGATITTTDVSEVQFDE
ncbi:hypothetical protein [uncultured Winogradskyella sp.]|nr:hypothetical protein [uncultured Winogradskyella sp.]